MIAELAERALLAEYRPWLRTVARNLLSDRHQDWIEDLAQEGWIGMWRALPKHDPEVAPLDFHLKMVATNTMKSALQKWLRAERGGKQGARINYNQGEIAVGHSAEVDFWSVFGVDLPGVELAYHYGEIAQALAELSPKQREYVILRFWYGYDQPAIQAHFGYVPRGVWAAARKKLSVALANLNPQHKEMETVQ